jgi:hypothetical protein
MTAALLAALAAVAGSADQGPLPHAYVRAIAAVDASPLKSLQAYEASKAQALNEVARAHGLRPDSRAIDYRRAEARYMPAVLALVREGNLVPIGPMELGALTEMRRISRLMTGNAQLRFSEGARGLGAGILLDGLQLSQNIADSDLLGTLVGAANQSIFLAAFDRHLPQLSLEQLRLVEAGAGRILSLTPPAVAALERERAQLDGRLALIAEDPEGYMTGLGMNQNDPPRWAGLSALVGLTAAERRALVPAARQRAGNFLADIQARFRGDEGAWLVGGAAPLPPDTALDAMTGLALGGLSSQEDLVAAMAKGRTQMRLLRLHCHILHFRHLHGVLPSDLKQLEAPSVVRDPLTGAAFVYERTEHGGYDLYSVGIKSIGKLHLRYMREPGAGPEGRLVRPPLP